MQTPERIEIEDGARVVVDWPGGASQTFTARQLRDACTCADCATQAENGRMRLVMATTIAEARLVGSYGINFTFSPDGHHTGIFTFDQLRALGDQT